MQTGVISAENFSQVLRSISQLRKQGVLEIQYSNKRVDVCFVQGRIVEASLFDVNPVHEVEGMLRAAGVIHGNLEEGWDASYDTLFRAISARDPQFGVVDETTFARVVKHRILDLLYVVVAKEGGFFHFKSIMIECSKHFSPSISVGQLLLDVVALTTEAQEFSEAFPSSCLIQRAVDVAPEGLGEEATVIFGLLSEGLSLEELRLKSLLSLYHFQESLFALLSSAVIRVGSPGVTSEKLLGSDLLNGLDSSIDDAFASFDQELDNSLCSSGLADQALEVDLNRGATKGNGTSDKAQELKKPALNGHAAKLVDQVEHDAERQAEDGDGDEYEEDDEDEYEEIRPGLKVRLGLLSFKLLNQCWVAHTVTVLGLLCGTLIPFLFWGRMLGAFGY